MGSLPKPKRYAIVGVGVRSSHYYDSILRDFSHVATLVALCDTNQTRMNYANSRIAAVTGSPLPTFKDTQFDEMITTTKPDTIIVLTIDKFHHTYCIRAMELGCDAITEKPMTISAENLQAMIDAEERTGKQVRVLFNYRYAPHHTKIRELIASGTIGEVHTVHMDWILDCAHGSDFMRRWHREKANSGGIQMHKSIHHFDLVHFWLATEPISVYAVGSLKFYDRENAIRRGDAHLAATERYHGDADSKDDPFRIDIQSESLKKLYLEAEHEDGYVRDRNCFAEGITIEDNLSMVIKYANGAVMSYNTYAYAPWEGYRCVFNGSQGRIEVNLVEGGYRAEGDPGVDNTKIVKEKKDGVVRPGVEEIKIVVYPLWGEAWEAESEKGEGGHGGGDPVLMRDVLLGKEGEEGSQEREGDRWGRAAYIKDGGNAVLVGVGANMSMESGQAVKVQELVNWEGSGN